MTAIAWAIVFLGTVVLDAAYTTKFGARYDGAGICGLIGGIALVGCVFCTAIELRKKS